MGTFDRFMKKMGDEIASKSKNVVSSIRPVDTAMEIIEVSPIQQKEAKMSKLGDHSEKEGGFEKTGSSVSRSPAGAGTLVGEHIAIEGIIRADEDIVIEGMVKGSIESKSHLLTVGPKGKVEGDVEAESVIVSGRMVGNILAHGKVQIMKSADFSGQIKTKRISVEDGAHIKASIELERDAKDNPQLQKPIEATVFSSGSHKELKTENLKPQTAK